nr:RecName: Full=Unknown protein 5 [Ginkgo biloba]
NNQLNASHK